MGGILQRRAARRGTSRTANVTIRSPPHKSDCFAEFASRRRSLDLLAVKGPPTAHVSTDSTWSKEWEKEKANRGYSVCVLSRANQAPTGTYHVVGARGSIPLLGPHNKTRPHLRGPAAAKNPLNAPASSFQSQDYCDFKLLSLYSDFLSQVPFIISSRDPKMAAVEVPARHKALVYDNPGSISTKIEEVETPKPGVGEVLVNLTHSGGKSSIWIALRSNEETLTCFSLPFGKNSTHVSLATLVLTRGLFRLTGHGSHVQRVGMASSSHTKRPSRWPRGSGQGCCAGHWCGGVWPEGW